ncbi:Tripartite-type tricarboxylate transporter, receptor component TctC [Rhodoferax sp. OV413]|uniref:Bug family tripartite tricarboxylate transporter substrate binding protein n=1 Tax=Rhodoferax sp. OV413 TaxID=1855285 RepID=UPI000883A778|nr:tripartite tricarboxylate transporter substrate binding protein [Rhodoferax sp. OV413]SDP40621.1 Tripartite-type tricarboxylate transporter, receptor component TctC [Rhodoferax sp. OV413]
MRFLFKILVLAQCVWAPLAAGAAEGDFPHKPIKVVVGFPAGQGMDTVARALAPKLQALLGQAVLVDNKAGAGGILGQQAVASAPPDGYTILLTSAGPMAVNPGVYDKLPYDPVKDYTPIAGVVSVPLVLVAHADLPARNVQQLLALARARPGEINFASSGNGVTNHLAMEMLAVAGGVRMTHVPYKGAPPALIDLMAGRVDVMFDTPVSVLPYIQEGRLKALAVSSSHRMAALPDVPTVAETYPGFAAVSWMAFVAPAHTPAPVVATLRDAVLQVVQMPEMQQYFLARGVEPMPLDSAPLARFIQSEVDKWGRAAKAAGAKVD